VEETISWSLFSSKEINDQQLNFIQFYCAAQENIGHIAGFFVATAKNTIKFNNLRLISYCDFPSHFMISLWQSSFLPQFLADLSSSNRSYNGIHPPNPSREIMECTVRWTGLSGMTFLAETGSGHVVTMDGAPEGGGRNLAPRPMEVVLAGTGGCTAYDVVLILRKSHQDVRGCDVTLKSERAEKDPKVFTKVHFHFTVRGRHLKPNLVERAIKLSHEKYCSASIMLEKTAELTHSFDIIDDLAEAVPE
jgi:putative redox protein